MTSVRLDLSNQFTRQSFQEQQPKIKPNSELEGDHDEPMLENKSLSSESTQKYLAEKLQNGEAKIIDTKDNGIQKVTIFSLDGKTYYQTKDDNNLILFYLYENDDNFGYFKKTSNQNNRRQDWYKNIKNSLFYNLTV